MPYRPEPVFRRNIRGVIYPLTAAVVEKYGARNDGAFPIGAFYPINVSRRSWEHAGGIWYIPNTDILGRSNREEVVRAFGESIETGAPVELPSAITVTWEPIPSSEASQLPRDVEDRRGT